MYWFVPVSISIQAIIAKYTVRLPSDLSDPVVGTTISDMNSSESETRNVSFVGVLNYTLLNRYVVHGSLNAEGNSAMGRNERMGYFPAVGLAWNFQNEPLLEKARE